MQFLRVPQNAPKNVWRPGSNRYRPTENDGLEKAGGKEQMAIDSRLVTVI